MLSRENTLIEDGRNQEQADAVAGWFGLLFLHPHKAFFQTSKT
jgi:hypothetical protein